MCEKYLGLFYSKKKITTKINLVEKLILNKILEFKLIIW